MQSRPATLGKETTLALFTDSKLFMFLRGLSSIEHRAGRFAPPRNPGSSDRAKRLPATCRGKKRKPRRRSKHRRHQDAELGAVNEFVAERNAGYEQGHRKADSGQQPPANHRSPVQIMREFRQP